MDVRPCGWHFATDPAVIMSRRERVVSGLIFHPDVDPRIQPLDASFGAIARISGRDLAAENFGAYRFGR